MNNKIKLVFENPTYNVLPDKGVVVCNCKCNIEFNSLVEKYIYMSINTLDYYKFLHFEVKGVARLKGNDKFNEKLGKKIAYTKAQNKAYNKLKSRLIEAKKSLLTFNNICNDNILELSSLENHNSIYLMSL